MTSAAAAMNSLPIAIDTNFYRVLAALMQYVPRDHWQKSACGGKTCHRAAPEGVRMPEVGRRSTEAFHVHRSTNCFASAMPRGSILQSPAERVLDN